MVQRRQSWGRHICGKGLKGGGSVYQKSSLPCFDSLDDEDNVEQGEGGSEGGGISKKEAEY